MDGISEDVREFIFEFIDSIEQLQIMMLLRSHRTRSWTALQVSLELRTNEESAAKRLNLLRAMGVLELEPQSELSYRYNPSPETEQVVAKLAEEYRIRPHKIYELIFSSLKRARKFMDAFTIRDKKEDGDV